MADEPSRGYVFVAIDRVTRWAFIAIKRRKTTAAERSFLNEVSKAAPFVIQTVPTDNGKEFTDRLFGSRAKKASGDQEFDLLCDSLGIEHRLTKPRTPRTNGTVKRLNGRLEQVLQTYRFNSAEDLSKTLHHLKARWCHQVCELDGGGSAATARLEHQAMDAQSSQRLRCTWHVQNVNAHHGRFTERIRRFNGVATSDCPCT